MRNHYAIAKFDDLGRLRALKVRIDDTMYIATPHDDGKGEREVFVNIDTAYAVDAKPAQTLDSERLKQIEGVRAQLERRYRDSRK